MQTVNRSGRARRICESGHGYAVALSRGLALGGDGAPAFVAYRYRKAQQFKRELANHGMKGRVVRVEWSVREVRS